MPFHFLLFAFHLCAVICQVRYLTLLSQLKYWELAEHHHLQQILFPVQESFLIGCQNKAQIKQEYSNLLLKCSIIIPMICFILLVSRMHLLGWYCKSCGIVFSPVWLLVFCGNMHYLAVLCFRVFLGWERYADNICLKDISRPCLICKAKWDNGRSSILMILCSWWLIGGRGCLPLDPHQIPVLCILHKGW